MFKWLCKLDGIVKNMNIEDRANYLFIEPEDEDETKVLQKILDDKTGSISLAVSFKGEVLGLKVWKIK